MLNLFYDKLWCLKLKIHYPIKQYSFHTESPVIKSVQKRKSQYTLHAKTHFIKDTLYILWYLTIYVVAFNTSVIWEMWSTKSPSLELISGTWNYRIGLDYVNVSREVHCWTLAHTNKGYDGYVKNLIVNILYWRRMIFSTMLQCDSLQQGLRQLSLII